MFGLTFEKLLVVTIIAAFIIGPRRLPIYAGKLADFARDLRAFIESTRARAEDDLGVPLRTSEWQVDLRQYDPRRIVRDALEDDRTATNSAPPHATAQTTDGTAAPEAAAPVKPANRQHWIVAGGTPGHPHRVLITEPVDTPAPATVAADAPATAAVPAPATAPPASQTAGSVQ